MNEDVPSGYEALRIIYVMHIILISAPDAPHTTNGMIVEQI